MPLLSLNLIICERILSESDGVLSAIRISDLFEFVLAPELPLDRQGVPISVLVVAKFSADEVGKPHLVQLRLVRPDGETTDMGSPLGGILVVSKAGVMGMNVIAPAFIIPKQIGMHFVHCHLDGAFVAKAPFTLSPRQPAPAD